MTLTELIADIKDVQRAPGWQQSPARSARFRRALIELHWRFAVPFAAPAFCFLGFPLGLINHRGGKASGFALSLVVIMFFWVALTMGRDIALDGRIPVLLGAWGPDLIVLAAALGLLFARQKRDVFSLPSHVRSWARSMQSRLAAGAPLKGQRIEAPPDSAVFSTTPAPRIRLPLIDLYLAKHFLLVFVLVLLSAATLYAVVELRSIVDSLLQRPLPFTLALKYLVYFTPGMMKIVTPVAAVVAALITLGSLCRANEDTALKAAGVSIFRISAPLLISTLGLSVLYFLTQDYVAPYTNHRASQILDEIEGRTTSATISGTRWVFGKDMRLYGFSDYDAGKKVLQGVSVVDLSDRPFRVRRRWWSPRVRWMDGHWIAVSGWQRDFRGEDEPYRPLEKTPLPWPETPEDFARQERSVVGWDRLVEEMNFFTLRQHIRKLENSGYDTTRLTVSLYEKLAFPAAPLVMVLIGLPFAFRTGRRGSLYGLGIALFLVIVYWSCFAISSALGQESILPPFLAAWSPNLLFALTGGYLFLSTRS